MKIIFTICKVVYECGDESMSLHPVCESDTLLPKVFETYGDAENWITADTTIGVAYQIQKLYVKELMKEYEMKCYAGSHPRIPVTEEFVTKNNLTLNRTIEEILKRIEESKGMFDHTIEVLCYYLPWVEAKKFFEKDYQQKVDDGNAEWRQIDDIYESVQDMLDYMVFGWTKAMDERGLSASRTISKVSAWLWLFGRDDLRRLIQDDSLYNPYGSRALIELNKELGIESPEDLIEFSKHKC